MTSKTSQTGFVLMAALLATAATAAPLAEPRVGTVKDRAGYFPKRALPALGGTAIGILASEVNPVNVRGGRSGPPDSMGFSADASSHRWVWVKTKDNGPNTRDLQFAGKDGKNKSYPRVWIANPAMAKEMGVAEPYALVEVEVNDGLGTPADSDGFVATRFKVLDGTKDYPLKVASVIVELRKTYDAFLQEEDKNITAAMEESRKAVKDMNTPPQALKPTTPDKKSTIVYVSWLSESQCLDVRFLTRINNGVTTFKPQIIPKRPPGTPPQPIPARNPYVHTNYGIELGMAYEVSKTGKILRRTALPIEAFKE